jgi:hypothetical protein
MSSIVCDASAHYEFRFDRSRHRRQQESLMENQKKHKEGYVGTSFNKSFFAEPDNTSRGSMMSLDWRVHHRAYGNAAANQQCTPG